MVPQIPALWRAAIGITRNHHEAEDLLQDTLLRAYRFIDSFDGRHPRAWLLTVMRNANQNRNRKRRPGVLKAGDVSDVDVFTDMRAGPDEVLEQATLDERIEAALGGLSAKLRQVVELVDVAGLSYDEGAAVLGVPVGTVTSRLHRARAALRKELENDMDLRGAAR